MEIERKWNVDEEPLKVDNSWWNKREREREREKVNSKNIFQHFPRTSTSPFTFLSLFSPSFYTIVFSFSKLDVFLFFLISYPYPFTWPMFSYDNILNKEYTRFVFFSLFSFFLLLTVSFFPPSVFVYLLFYVLL